MGIIRVKSKDYTYLRKGDGFYEISTAHASAVGWRNQGNQ